MCLWTKWHWGRFSPSTSVSPVDSQFINCPTFINHSIIRRYVISFLRAWLCNQLRINDVNANRYAGYLVEQAGSFLPRKVTYQGIAYPQKYCNGFDQRVARQQPSKYLPTHATQQWRNLCFLFDDVTQQWRTLCFICDDVTNNRDGVFYGVWQSAYERS
jgi:hypothetical protein